MAKRGRPPHPDILTPREWEVHALLREGLSNEAIAERLAISLAGAKYHVSEILSKLGVASREEAAAWTREQRPWWQAGVAPFAALWPKASASWLSIGATAIVAIAIAAGIGLLVWGVVRTGGSGEPHLFAAEPIDCPGGLASPEDAIGACLETFGDGYAGDCQTARALSLSRDPLQDPCSSWAEGLTSLRAYVLSMPDTGPRFYWLTLSQRADGWTVTQRVVCEASRAGSGNQGPADVDIIRSENGMDVSTVRADDCRYPPAPHPRPAVRLGPAGGTAPRSAIPLAVTNATFRPDRGIKLWVATVNLGAPEQSWTPVAAQDIELVSERGGRIIASEVGGNLTRSVQASVGGRPRYVSGWVVFPIEQLDVYSFQFPGEMALRIDLTSEEFNASSRDLGPCALSPPFGRITCLPLSSRNSLDR